MSGRAPAEWREGHLIVSTDRARLDLGVIHEFLTTCYWSPGIPRDVVDRAIAGSLCFGVYDAKASRAPGQSTQIGFARVVTDGATFAYLADVFILESHRSLGAGKFLMRTIMAHPDLQGLRRFMLLTRDAHGLYEQFGFGPCARPERVMEKLDPNVYKRSAQNQSRP